MLEAEAEERERHVLALQTYADSMAAVALASEADLDAYAPENDSVPHLRVVRGGR